MIFNKKLFFLLVFLSTPYLLSKTNICIVIPAYNEEDRIESTLRSYAQYFKNIPEKVTFLVVANNCCDNTVKKSEALKKTFKNIIVMDIVPGGKGLAIKKGFEWASRKNFDLIGFVDADMATLPQHYYDLILSVQNHDGAIASRYAKGAQITPKRPFIRKVGGKFYNWMLRKITGLPYKDTQCGAKIFTKQTIVDITPLMHEIGWSFDLELLYLCKLFEKDIIEVATTWSDQPGSHLQISRALAKEFLSSPKRIKKRHKDKKKELKRIAQEKKRAEKRQKKESKKSKAV